jgi:SAM-dependent methyltransferase
LIEEAGPPPDAILLDVGGGASTLVDRLIDRGFTRLIVTDVSRAALDTARERVGARGASVRWLLADARHMEWEERVDLWHDRAVFHFLTDPGDRASYLRGLRTHLRPGGHAIFATFALDGPERCSGLPVARYGPDTLAAALGPGFRLLRSVRHAHRTPGGETQRFTYALFRHDTTAP